MERENMVLCLSQFDKIRKWLMLKRGERCVVLNQRGFKGTGLKGIQMPVPHEFDCRDVTPMTSDKNCAACHAKHPKEAPTLSGVRDGQPWLPSCRALKPFAFFYDGGGAFTESKTFPGKFGARASKLYALLSKGHHDVKLSPDDRRRITLWLDCNSDFYGTYENIQAQACGEIVRPIVE